VKSGVSLETVVLVAFALARLVIAVKTAARDVFVAEIVEYLKALARDGPRHKNMWRSAFLSRRIRAAFVNVGAYREITAFDIATRIAVSLLVGTGATSVPKKDSESHSENYRT
jgi:hypothetical protein